MSRKPTWLKDAALQQFFAAVKAEGGDVRAVGGAVRDTVMGRSSGDIDFATTLKPEAVLALAKQQGWKAVPTGIDHGTVTVIIDHKGYEVTTLRRDVSTDGRRATVAYTDDWEEDAARRDFTINALYMDAQGVITDFFGGQDDIASKTLRFIGDADLRIQEDGLRMLRYFRFLAQLGWKADTVPVAACARHAGMLEKLSGERIQQEMKKLLDAADPQHALQHMAGIGFDRLLTQTTWRQDVPLITHDDLAGEGVPWVRLMSLMERDARKAALGFVIERWRLSNRDRDLLQYLMQATDKPDEASVKLWLYRGISPAWLDTHIQLYEAEHGVDLQDLSELARSWKVPRLPVSAKDLLARGMTEGPELGQQLRAIEQRWIGSDYQLTKAALLAE